MPEYLRIFQTLSDHLLSGVGHRLFTVSYAAPGAGTAQRIFTTAPEVYPLSGVKPVTDSDWTRQMRSGQAFVAHRPQDFGPHFFDLDTIVGLGLGAIVNVPVMRDGQMLGSLNLLDQEGAYQDASVLPALAAVMPQALQGFAAYEREMKSRA